MKKESNTVPPYQVGNVEKYDIQDYLPYPPGEDIYNKFKEEEELDPENTSKVKLKSQNERAESDLEIDFENDESGNDLDVPGSELDDEQEIIGNEDEENNYYSIGGDDHNDLDEDKDNM
jgi:hypothetical protein